MSRALLSSILVSAALTALAPAAAARPGNAPVQHDRGFFMRLSAGAGYGSATVDDGQDTKFSGFAGTASFAFGGTIMRNFALHADFFGLSMFEPKFESGGVSGTVQDTTARFFGFGVGVTGYVMPANVYFSGSLGAGIASLQFRTKFLGAIIEDEEDSRVGFAGNLMIGKEWWVARKWGIGLAGQFMFGAVRTDNDDALGVIGFGLLFSATMN